MNDFDPESGLAHVIALVTGAAGGIGRVLVHGLLARGARVLATDVDEARLASLDASTPALDRDRLALHCGDLDARGAEKSVLSAAVAAFGAINTLVCSSGLGRGIYTQDLLRTPPSVWEIPDEVWQRMFQTNALSPIRLINAAMPLLRQRPWGRVVTVTTSLDHMLAGGSGPYGPSKSALEAYTSVLACELEGCGTTANVLVPGGVVDTPMVPDLEGVSRQDFLSPAVMLPPLAWLLSRHADTVNCQRVRASLWDPTRPPADAFATASASAGWWSLAAGQQRRVGTT